jgi:hypothetical protein
MTPQDPPYPMPPPPFPVRDPDAPPDPDGDDPKPDPQPSLGARDPRTDPQPGDELRIDGIIRCVILQGVAHSAVEHSARVLLRRAR